LLTLVLFNLFNMSFSAGVQIRYIDQVDSWNILCLLFSFTLVVIITMAQFFTDPLEFGEYRDKFKGSTLQANYVTATVIYRFTLGLLMALLNEWRQGPIIFLLLGGAFLAYIFAF
jgi:hypothetical protein